MSRLHAVLFFSVLLILAPNGRLSAAEWDWTNAKQLTLEGQGWTDTESLFDRLPAKAKGVVRDPVWSLSHHSAGLCVRFRTNSTSIAVNWSLSSDRLNMPHMPTSGVSGVDLYLRDSQGRWRWVANGRPNRQSDNTTTLISGLDGKEHEAMVYFPLYNGVTQLSIGTMQGTDILPLPRDETAKKPIVFWGTSITHGACASRPGMVHTAILGRRLNRPVINLGFSGNGRMESEVAELIAELDAEVFVVDCLPNLKAPEVKERAPVLVEILRKAHPKTPIVLVEDRTYADGWINPGKLQRNLDSRRELKEAYDRLKAADDPFLLYIRGEGMLGDDDEATVDSSHPTDLGFYRMAEHFEPIIRKAMASQ
ncbi:MAG: SGNH/GDSL hydrolase family protein [Planctomycetota bacterium]|nr:SGNH/GDSL hydrolase family protein [Planctomycetota bacterium]